MSKPSTRKNFQGIPRWLVRFFPVSAYLSAYRRPYVFGLLALSGVDLLNVLLPLTIKEGVDAVTRTDQTALAWAAGLYLVFTGLQSIGRYYWRVFLIGTSHLVANDLREKIFSKYQKLAYPFYQTTRSGDLMSRITNDVESVRMGLGPGVLVAADAIILLAFIVPAMFFLNWKLALISLSFFPLVPTLTQYFGNKIDDQSEKIQEGFSRMGNFIQEHLTAVRLIKSLRQENRVVGQFQGLSERQAQEGLILARYQATLSPALGWITNMGTFLILYWGGRYVLQETLSLGTFIAFQRFVVQLAWPMEAIGWSIAMTREANAAKRRLDQVEAYPEIVSEFPSKAPQETNAKSLLWIKTLKDTLFPESARSFSFDLENLQISSGQRVGVVGPVGSGKSLFTQFVLRFHEPKAQEIFWKGKDIREIPLSHWRETITGVEQSVTLLGETLRANLTLGIKFPVTDSNLEECLEWACLIDEVRAMPRGLDTPLGERGINLSGGQKQRLALARALLRRPELLLLDDCFSAVDPDVEKRVIDRILRLPFDTTLLIFTHRLAILPALDSVWVFDRGRRVAEGSHPGLLQQSTLYRELWREKAPVEKEVKEKDLVL